MFNLNKVFFVVGLVSMSTFAVNASSGDSVNSTTVINHNKIGDVYYATITPQDTLSIVPTDSGNSALFELTKTNGIYQFPGNANISFLPYKVVNIQGYYPVPTQIEKVATRIAIDNKAYAFHINRIEGNSQSGNTRLQIALYEKNAPLFYNSAIYHVYNGKNIRELTLGAEKNMNPMGQFQFSGSYTLSYEITAEAAKEAIAKGASAFYVTSITENTQGTNQTVSVNYYK